MFLKGQLQVEHSWMNVNACLGRLISPTEQCLSTECIHCEGPPHKTYGIACTSMGCVITTITSSSIFSSLPQPPWLTRVPFAALCGSVCVFDCGKISWLSVRVARSLDWLFPWVPLGSLRLRPATALQPRSSLHSPAVTAVAEFLLCLPKPLV